MGNPKRKAGSSTVDAISFWRTHTLWPGEMPGASHDYFAAVLLLFFMCFLTMENKKLSFCRSESMLAYCSIAVLSSVNASIPSEIDA